MFTIVGLGNPGTEYEHTRHNVGWMVLTHVLTAHGLTPMTSKAQYSGMVREGMLFDKEMIVLFPTTFMNRSGVPVAKCLAGEKGSVAELIVVHDDIDLTFGTIRVSWGSGAGGHNGVQSIIDALGTKNFIRVRVGIAHKGLFGIVRRPRGEALSRYVLNNFSNTELEALKDLSRKVESALKCIMTEGVERARQVYTE